MIENVSPPFPKKIITGAFSSTRVETQLLIIAQIIVYKIAF
jgi:hypothetical protein